MYQRSSYNLKNLIKRKEQRVYIPIALFTICYINY
jgi:hypothetical protein